MKDETRKNKMGKKKVRIAIVGFGNVGKGVAEVIKRKKREIRRKYGLDMRVVSIVDLWGAVINEEGLDIDTVQQEIEKIKRGEGEKWLKMEQIPSLDVIRNVEHDVTVEATPTNIENGEPGLSHILAALESKRHVVTSNKGPLAVQYDKIMRAAKENDVEIRFEAAVGGAMPIISVAKEMLAGNEILSIKGILNGTCNYILTGMTKEGLPYEHVLKEAQQIGIAESDPIKDVLGIDTAVKLVILANYLSLLGTTATASYNDVNVVGITDITPEALKLADDEGYVIKLVGEVEKEGRVL